MSSTTSLIVTIVTLVNFLGALWLLWAVRRKGPEPAPGTETTGHVWDGDLREFNNPLPRWWLWMFIGTGVIGLIYLWLYPGLGTYAGSKGWTQQAQWEEQTRAAEAVLARTFAPFEALPVVELEKNADAQRIGRNLFLNNCATCHGSDGRGAPGFPNLTDKDWQYGGTPDVVVETITNGRMGVMTPWGEVLGRENVENVLAYVLSLSGRKAAAGDVEAGKAKFGEICSSCHGIDGKGNPLVGAPNLTDNTWLYGGSPAAIRETIEKGRQGQMPAHGDRLGATRVKILASYVLGMAGGSAAQPPVHQMTVATEAAPAADGASAPATDAQ